MQHHENPIGLCGIEFIEFSTGEQEFMHQVFLDFGFSMTKKLKGKEIYYYNQNDIHFLLNKEEKGFGFDFTRKHGPAVCSMGWRVYDANTAFDRAVARGALPVANEDKDLNYPAVYGIGDSLIYFIEKSEPGNSIFDTDFDVIENPLVVEEKGFIRIDHLTNNVYQGTMEKWAEFYKSIFGFYEVRYFDINGIKTGLVSYALSSPDGSFCIPVNEGKNDDKNQIDEYLHEYNGPGVQHIAFLTRDILDSLDKMKGTCISTLDINDGYYDEVFDRVPCVKEDKMRIKKHQVLVDGNDDSYLLQIFTKNLFGPIFIELIQRERHQGFGEGNFTALFKSIERDQEERGVLG